MLNTKIFDSHFEHQSRIIGKLGHFFYAVSVTKFKFDSWINPRGGEFLVSYGAGKSHREAILISRFEAVERFSAIDAIALKNFEIKARPQNIGQHVTPSELMQFSKNQYANRIALNRQRPKYDYITEDYLSEEISWVKAKDMFNSSQIFVPKSFVYYLSKHDQDLKYCYNDSNGMAAGCTLDDANKRALFELIERDSVSIWWHNMLGHCPTISPSSYPSELGPFEEEIKKLKANLIIVDIKTELGVPCVVAMMTWDFKRYLLGFGASHSYRGAIIKAAKELGLSVLAMCFHAKSKLEESAFLIENYSGSATCEWIDVNNHFVDLDLDSSNRDTKSILLKNKLKVFSVDLTNDAWGIPVVKLISPNLRHWNNRLAPGRLYESPVRAGFLHSRKYEHELNGKFINL